MIASGYSYHGREVGYSGSLALAVDYTEIQRPAARVTSHAGAALAFLVVAEMVESRQIAYRHWHKKADIVPLAEVGRYPTGRFRTGSTAKRTMALGPVRQLPTQCGHHVGTVHEEQTS